MNTRICPRLSATDGHPVVVIPCGLDHEGMPFGLQVVGRFGADRELLAVARSLEAALAGIPICERPVPNLGALSAVADSEQASHD